MLHEEGLLGADDAAGSADANVPDGLLCGEAVVLDHVAADENACAAQPCFAMDSQRTWNPMHP